MSFRTCCHEQQSCRSVADVGYWRCHSVAAVMSKISQKLKARSTSTQWISKALQHHHNQKKILWSLFFCPNNMLTVEQQHAHAEKRWGQDLHRKFWNIRGNYGGTTETLHQSIDLGLSHFNFIKSQKQYTLQDNKKPWYGHVPRWDVGLKSRPAQGTQLNNNVPCGVFWFTQYMSSSSKPTCRMWDANVPRNAKKWTVHLVSRPVFHELNTALPGDAFQSWGTPKKEHSTFCALCNIHLVNIADCSFHRVLVSQGQNVRMLLTSFTGTVRELSFMRQSWLTYLAMNYQVHKLVTEKRCTFRTHKNWATRNLAAVEKLLEIKTAKQFYKVTIHHSPNIGCTSSLSST